MFRTLVMCKSWLHHWAAVHSNSRWELTNTKLWR